MRPTSLVPRRCRTALAAAWLAAAPLPALAGVDWPTWGMDMQRTGNNPAETALSVATVPNLKQHWAQQLGGPILTQPIVLSAIGAAPDGPLDLVLVGTMTGQLYALDAATGREIWHRNLARVQTGCDDFAPSKGIVGILATPTVPASRDRIYVVSGDDRLHALDPASGKELTGWPLAFLAPGLTDLRNAVYGSPSVIGTNVYVTTGAVCDTAPFRGEVVEIDGTAHKVLHRFFPVPAGISGGGIWGPGGVSVEPDGSALYAATAFAVHSPQDVARAEHVVQLGPTLALLAANGPKAPGVDPEFGATPLLFQADGCPPELAAMNKSGRLYLYDRTGIAAGPKQTLQIGRTDLSDPGSFIGLPAYDPVRRRIYLGSTTDSDNGMYRHGLLAFDIASKCTLSLAWQNPVDPLYNQPYDNPVISPVVANGVVYYADGLASRVYALDATTGTVLWNTGTPSDAGIFASPSVVDGQLYFGGMDGTLYAFGL